MADPHTRPISIRRARRFALLGAGAAAAALFAWPAIGLQSAAQPAVPPSESDAPSAPRSLLPDMFDTPAPSAPAPAAPLLPGLASPESPAAVQPDLPPLLTATPVPTVQPVDPFALAFTNDSGVSGPLTLANGGYGAATFTGSRGRFLAGLNRRLNAPLGSRWAAITLRRALLSQSVTPYGITTGDWTASRAYTLMRMGEIDGAKALVDGLPVDRYTPMLYRVASEVALAAADLGGLCPIAVTGRSLFSDSKWQLAVGMCAAMQGDDFTAASIFDDLRKANDVEPFDLRLAERVATISGGAGRASNINWDEAPSMNLYRYGVATAAGVPIPADKLASLGLARYGWLVRSAGVAPDVRLASLRPAAVIGTVSVEELTSGISALSSADTTDTPAGLQRTAFAGASVNDRRNALRTIWASGGANDRYGALLESASAAARLPIGSASADDSAVIIAALLAAGNTAAARRWWPVADKANANIRADAWALLAVAGGGVPVSTDEFDSWRSATKADDRRAGLLMAALAGLGTRGSDWNSLKSDLLPRAGNSWTRAIDAAAAAGRTGEVAILTATALQGPWSQVSPLHLYHLTAALTRVGRTSEARLIAAEALTRA